MLMYARFENSFWVKRTLSCLEENYFGRKDEFNVQWFDATRAHNNTAHFE